MSRKLVFVLGLFVLLSSSLYVRFDTVEVKAPNGYPVHNLDTGRNYTSIQEAIDNNETLDGHTIFVEEGTYCERLVVYKSLTLIGEDKSSTIIDGGNFGDVIDLFKVENVSISGFTIRNSGSTFYDHGILISYSSNITVYDNIITENNYGVRLISSNNNNISKNSIMDNIYRGIDLTTSSHNIICENNITDSSHGVRFLLSYNNTLLGNIVSGNIDGLVLERSDNNTLLNNIVSNNTAIGICLLLASSNTFRSNIMTNNTWNFAVGFYELVDSFNDVDVSNLVNSKPIYYWIDKHDDEVPLDAGYVALVNCNNITVNNLTLENNIPGILLANTNNSLLTHNNIRKTDKGIILTLSHNNTISSNAITNDTFYGIVFSENSYNNTVIANNITNNWGGIFLDHSNNNVIFHNNFVNNSEQTYRSGSTNIWDNGVEGNYWSNYTGVDSDYDGIGDSEHVIDENNQDNYPLMGMFSSFNTSLGYNVNVISNSTIEDFQYFESNNTIKMHVANMTISQTYGFCRVCIPHTLMNETYQVTIDGAEPYYVNYTLYDDGDNRWIYFSYEHSTLEIVIVPEFPSFLILPVFMIATLLIVIVYRRKHSRRERLNSKI